MPAAIVCRDLKKTYPGKKPVEAVRGIDLQIEMGECFGLLGPNGAGKTTTLEILEGLHAPTSGEVEILGLNWKQNETQLRQKIGISLQETRLSELLTVGETVRLFRSFYREGMAPEDAIARVSLQDKTNARVKSLSGGQKQRLSVAVAIVGNPQLLFLDEPTTGLDPTSRRELWGIIQSFMDEGRNVILSTHYLEEAERLCQRVAIVDRGKVIAIGSPRQLIAELGGQHVVEFSLTTQVGENEFDWNQLPGVQFVRRDQDMIALTVAEPHVTIPELLSCTTKNHWTLSSLTTRQASLDDVFIKLTGRKMEQAEKESAA